jgi:hypothetical protein
MRGAASTDGGDTSTNCQASGTAGLSLITGDAAARGSLCSASLGAVERLGGHTRSKEALAAGEKSLLSANVS